MFETDLDAGALLSRALSAVEIGQYRDAVLILDHVIAEYGHFAYETEAGMVRNVRSIAERHIADMPAEGLALYRIHVDARARALVAEPIETSRDIEALRSIVDRYFLSGAGDDAAYVLAGLMLDRGEARHAHQLLSRVIERYPDPSIDQRDLLTRYAYASATMGSTDQVERVLLRLETEFDVTQTKLQRVRDVLARSTSRVADTASQSWQQAWGGANRTGVMPSLIGDPLQHGRHRLAVAWSQPFPLVNASGFWGQRRYALNGMSMQSWPSLIMRWREHDWTPTRQILFRDGRMYFATPLGIECREIDSGQRVWGPSHDPSNDNKITHASYRNASSQSWPTTQEELFGFGDRLGGAMSLVDDTLFYIDRNDQANWPRAHEVQNAARRNQIVPAGNRLVAQDIQTGRARWTRGLAITPTDTLASVRFLAAPVPFEQNVITVVDRNGELFLIALEADTGHIAWEQFLCGSPSPNLPPVVPAGLLIDSDHVFVLPGNGAVFCHDAHAGSLIWARRYAQSFRENQRHRHSQQAVGRELGLLGWEDNALFVRNRTLAVAPWDAQQLLLLDRDTGAVRLSAETAESIQPLSIDQPRYCLGLHDDHLILAMGDELTAVELTTGQTTWRAPLENITGRAAITADAAYVPCDDAVVVVDLIGEGRLVASIPVHRAGRIPLGNLVCDGDRLLGVGPGHAYSLIESDRYLTRLDDRIESEQDAEAYLARAIYNQQFGDPSLVMDDLRVAFASDSHRVRQRARGLLFEEMLARANADSTNPIALYDEIEALLIDDPAGHVFRFRLQMARADRLASLGRFDEALTRYQELIADHNSGDQRMIIEQSGSGSTWTGSPLRAARAAMTRMIQQAPDDLAARYEQHATEQLTQLESIQDPVARLGRLCEFAADYSASDAAKRAIASMTQGHQEIPVERVESRLASLTLHPDDSIAASALFALASYYEQTGDDHAALKAWRQIDTNHAHRVLHPDHPEVTGSHAAPDRIHALLGRNQSDPIQTSLSAPPWRKLWELRGWGNFVLTEIGRENSRFASRDALVINRNKMTLSAVNASHNLNRPKWSVNLPRQIVHSVMFSSEGVYFGGMFDRDVMIVPDALNGTLSAFGMVSGEQLWETKAPMIGGQFTSYYFYGVRQSRQMAGHLAISDGVMAMIDVSEDRYDRVTARDTLTGRTLWSRTFKDRTLIGLWVHSGYVCVFYDDLAHAELFDAQTGRAIRTIALEDFRRGYALMWDTGHLLYVNDNDLVCVNLATGDKVWQREYGSSRVEQVGQGLVVMANLNRETELIEVRTGNVVKAFGRDQFGDQVRYRSYAITRDGGELYMLGYERQSHTKPILVIIDLDGQMPAKVIRFDGRFATNISARLLADAGEYIPWVVRETNDDGNPTGRWRVKFYRKTTGAYDPKLRLPTKHPHNAFEATHRPPVLVAGMFVIGGNSGVTAYGPKPKPQAGGAVKKLPLNGNHTVSDGESLYQIARRYYGNGEHWKHIYQSNRHVLKSPQDLRVGMTLKITPLTDDSATEQEKD